MKILVDLDVLTVAFWNRHEEALEFLARVKSGEFEVSTPYVLFDVEKLTKELLETGVKEEDAVLVVVTSLFSLGYLVTYNRKHLRSKSKEINEVLEKYGLRKISILLPTEI